MAFSHSITYNFQQGSGAVQQFSRTTSFDGQNDAQVTVPQNSNNFAVAFAMNSANLVSFVLWSNAAMTVNFNGSSGLIQSYTLVPNLPIIWDAASGESNPFSASVTGVTVTSVPGGELNIYAGLNI